MKRPMILLSICLIILGSAAPLRAEEIASTEILSKLGEISDSQKQILDSLEQMKAELQVIKVRTTR